MARGGSRGRRSNYVRDNSGRFASTPGGGPPKRSTPASRRAARPTVTGGTLGARGSLRRSRAKLAGKNPADRSLQGTLSLRAQKGAVTRGANRLGKARVASTVRMAARAGVIRGGRKVAAGPVAAPKDYKRGRSAALGYKPKADGTRPATSGARVLSARLNASQRKKAAEARQRYGVRSTAQRARTRAGSYDPAKQGGGRVTFRSRLAAKKAYLMRAVATKNIANRKASDFTSGLEYQGSLKAKSATVSQGNLLTGDTERIKRVRVRSASPKSAIMGVLKREAAKSGRPMAPRKPVTPRAPRYAYKKINRANANLDRASKAINKLEKRLEKSNTPKSQKALAKARKSAAVAFKARRLLNREPSRFYGRGSGRRVKSGAPRPSGTIAKPRGLKPGAIAARKAKAAASGARAARATTNYNRAQKAALEAQQRLNRRRSPKNQAAADRAQKTLRTAARAYRILVGLGGEKMATPRKPSPKGAGPRMKAARPAGTVAKPKGVKVEALAKEAGKPGKRLGRVAGPLPVDGVRRRGETTRNRSDVSGAVADIKALGLPIYKPRTARSPGQEGIRVRKGPRAGTVGIIAHTLEAFDRALALVKKQGGEILYQNKQGQAFTFRNPRRPKP